ncbi:uncharacterized protein METZ01_LOCUS215188 [marine metagenome]|uniref:Uncharacterized protein n=1 Tax=marine metagenome TaxID=408172 RepID=A0A382FJ64_9ZZZZ
MTGDGRDEKGTHIVVEFVLGLILV